MFTALLFTKYGCKQHVPKQMSGQISWGTSTQWNNIQNYKELYYEAMERQGD
jgi:hypothetical protein